MRNLLDESDVLHREPDPVYPIAKVIGQQWDPWYCPDPLIPNFQRYRGYAGMPDPYPADELLVEVSEGARYVLLRSPALNRSAGGSVAMLTDLFGVGVIVSHEIPEWSWRVIVKAERETVLGSGLVPAEF